MAARTRCPSARWCLRCGVVSGGCVCLGGVTAALHERACLEVKFDSPTSSSCWLSLVLWSWFCVLQWMDHELRGVSACPHSSHAPKKLPRKRCASPTPIRTVNVCAAPVRRSRAVHAQCCTRVCGSCPTQVYSSACRQPISCLLRTSGGATTAETAAAAATEATTTALATKVATAFATTLATKVAAALAALRARHAGGQHSGWCRARGGAGVRIRAQSRRRGPRSCRQSGARGALNSA